MKKLIVFFLFLTGCSPTNIQSCDLCGKWSFDEFEYAGYITTDCEDIARRFYQNTYILIDVNSFYKTYSTDNTPNEINNTYIVFDEYNPDEKAYMFFIKSGNETIERFYKLTPDTIYLSMDGCRFYFKR